MTTIANEQPTDPRTPHLLDLTEASRALRIGRSTLYLYVNRGLIKTVKLQGRHLVAPADLADFIAGLRDDGRSLHV